MRIHIIACRIFSRELSYLASQSDNTIDITWMGRGLHNDPANLRSHLSDAVDELYHQIENGELDHRPDAIVLGYGLCSNGVIGVRCRDISISRIMPFIFSRRSASTACSMIFCSAGEKQSTCFSFVFGRFSLFIS